MKNIDFLPNSYREQYDQRRATLSRVLLVVALALAVGLASYSQHRTRRQLMSKLEESQLLHKQAAANQAQLADLETKLHRMNAVANLVTYLRHPWPRTKIISALLEPLPPEITLDKIQLTRETDTPSSANRNQPTAPAETAVPEANNETAAAREDLKQLRAEIDPGHTVVWISGTTQNNAVLHLYLVKLGHSPLLRDPQLKSVESSPTEDTSIRFVASLRVKAGYGQPVHRTDDQDEPPTMAQREIQP